MLVLSSAPPSASGLIWSRWVAKVTRPAASQSAQSGDLANSSARMRCSLRPVVRLVGVAFLAHCNRGCLAQRFEPSRTNAPQPGAVHGRGAETGIVRNQKTMPLKFALARALGVWQWGNPSLPEMYHIGLCGQLFFDCHSTNGFATLRCFCFSAGVEPVAHRMISSAQVGFDG